MNFLAHLHLSGTDPRIMVGNFIGDFVKGKKMLDQFDPAIVKGIDLHRSIDHFTDHHAVVSQSKNRLRPVYRHYSGVIVDVYYDHFLAVQWSRYNTTHSLEDFAGHAYATLQQYEAILPERVQEMLPYMMRGNWLVNYSRLEGIQRALTGMSRRTPYESKMDESVNDLRRHYADFQQEFEIFYPELMDFATKFLKQV